SAMANPDFFYTNGLIASVPAAGGTPTALSSAFDEDPSLVAWKAGGIYFSASEKTYACLYRLDPESKTIDKVAAAAATQTVNASFALSKDGRSVAFLRADARSMPEVYVVSGPSSVASRLTEMNAQTSGWTTSTLEVVSWKSQDGATIEGILHKPIDF